MKLRHWIEYAVVRSLYGLFACLSIDRASALGGWIGRTIGPRLRLSQRARDNLRTVFPEKSPEEIEHILRGMWDNLGRVFAEYPHLGRIKMYDGDRVTVEGAHHVDQLREDGQGGIFFAGHIGNWELASLGATQRGVPLVHVYRAPNNPLVAKLLEKARAPIGGAHHAKSPAGARALMKALRGGEHLGMLIDQKYNEGIAVPFFGRDAMTAPAIADFYFRFNVPVVPARVERLNGARFRLTVYPPIEFESTGDRDADRLAAMTRVNALFEDWIRDRPEQWLWLHRRWPK